MFEYTEIRFRVIRWRRVARMLRRLLMPQAFLLFVLSLFRPIGAVLFERHEILFHTIFFVFFLPSLWFFTLALESSPIPRLISSAFILVTYLMYYAASLAEGMNGVLYISVLSLGSIASLYFVTYPVRSSIELLGFLSFRLRAPKQAFRYIRGREVFYFFVLVFLMAFIENLRLYFLSLIVFLLFRRHFLTPIEVVRTIGYVMVKKPRGLKPAIVLPAEPRGYLLGVRNNIGFVSFLILSSAALGFLRGYQAFFSILLGSSLSGLTILSAYALYYGIRHLDVYMVSIKVSPYERVVVVGLLRGVLGFNRNRPVPVFL